MRKNFDFRDIFSLMSYIITKEEEMDMEEFRRMNRLPPYVFATVNTLKMELRRQGEDIIDLGMGNPDLATPKHIVDKLREACPESA